MFDFVRKHTRVMQFLLFLLIFPSFVLFGLEGYNRFREGGATVATVDGHDITQAEWDAAHRNQVERMRSSRCAAEWVGGQMAGQWPVHGCADHRQHRVGSAGALCPTRSCPPTLLCLRLHMLPFVLQNEGLVPWGAQPDVLIDRYDVRSLLDIYVPPHQRWVTWQAVGWVSERPALRPCVCVPWLCGPGSSDHWNPDSSSR